MLLFPLFLFPDDDDDDAAELPEHISHIPRATCAPTNAFSVKITSPFDMALVATKILPLCSDDKSRISTGGVRI